MEISGRGWPWGTFHRPIEHFDQLHIITLVADLDETFTLKFKRHYPLPLPNGSDRIGLATLGVSPIAIIPGVSAPAFGIAPARSLVVAKPEGKVDMPFHPGDVLAEVDGQPINDYWQLEDLEKGFDGREVKLAALRDGKPVEAQLHPLLEMQNVIFRSDGTRVSGALMPYGDKQTTLTAITADGKQTQLPRDKVLLKYREPMDILGMIPRLQVRGIVKGSPADEAGLLPGDIINGYSENGAPTFQQFQDWKYHEDPFFFFWKKKVYEPTTLHILRDNNPLTVSVTPTAINDEAKVGLAIGSDQDHLDVAGIRENSPVFRAFEKDARLERGDMTNAEIIAKFKGYKLDKVNGQDVHNWIAVLNILKDAQRQEIGLVELSLSQGASSKVLKVDLTPAAFSAQDYGFLIDVPFEPLEVKIIKHSPGAAISWGATETRDFMINAYASIRALVKGNISPQAASGPVGLAAASMQFARKGFMSFVYFMAIISTILAVMNFLPIPVVDGGLAVFLIVEKILGKPLPIKVQNIVQLAGLILMVGVFLAVTWHDIARLIKGMW
jgi:membrane-associated protease RseP (regulator of RpoE activity)